MTASKKINIIGQTYESLAKIVSSQLIVLDNTKNLKIKDIKNSILFLFASWSPTIVFFKLLIDVLKENNINDITIYILNIDGISYSFYEKELKSLSHGKGETFWIKNGKIIGELLNYNEGYEDKVKIFTEKIIDISTL